MRDINKYAVFKKSHEFTLEIYKITKQFPKEEMYGLVQQMRRAAYSIPMNLKEGSVGTKPEFFRFVRIAFGSCQELDYQLFLSKELNYVKDDVYKRLDVKLKEISKMLNSLLKKRS